MNNTSTKNNFPDAIILYANYASFSPGKVIRFDQVQSRMFLWCKKGKGTITVNREKFTFLPGNFLIIPWNHMIHYKADMKDPFLLAGIHLVPERKKRGKVLFRIFHDPQPDLAEYACRKDAFIPGFSSVFAGDLYQHEALKMLAEYIVMWFQRQENSEDMARILAQAFISELLTLRLRPAAAPLPRPLNKMIDYINDNLERKIEVSDLAALGECSHSTVFRLFRAKLKCTPVVWILKMKTAHAAELLKKTNLRVGEIGNKVCIDDPYYFSKIFKRFTGMTATQYRNSHSLVNPRFL